MGGKKEKKKTNIGQYFKLLNSEVFGADSWGLHF